MKRLMRMRTNMITIGRRMQIIRMNERQDNWKEDADNQDDYDRQ